MQINGSQLFLERQGGFQYRPVRPNKLPFSGPMPSSVEMEGEYSSELPPVEAIYKAGAPTVLNVRGAKVILEKNPDAVETELGIYVKSGLMTDPIIEGSQTGGRNGLSHVVEHSRFVSNGKRSNIELENSFRRVGASYYAITSNGFTAYKVNSPNEKIVPAAKALLETVFSYEFDPIFRTDLDAEIRNVISNELHAQALSSSGLLSIYSRENSTKVWDNHPFYSVSPGTVESVSKIDMNDVAGHLMRNYGLNNIVISVSGNFDEKEVTDLIKNALSGVPDTCDPERPPEYNYTGNTLKVEPEYENDEEASPHTLTVFSAQAPASAEGMDVYATALLNKILRSRLHTQLRLQERLGYSFGSYYHSGYMNSGGSELIIQLTSNRNNTQRAIDKAAEIIRDIEANGVTESELVESRYRVVSNSHNDFISGSSRVDLNAAIGMHTLGEFGDHLTIDRILAPYYWVTKDDVHKAAEILTKGNVNVGYIGSDLSSLDFSAV